MSWDGRRQVRFTRHQREQAKKHAEGRLAGMRIEDRTFHWEATGPVGPKTFAKIKRFMQRLAREGYHE